MRLDKLLANSGFGSRKEVKKLLSDKAVIVNGVLIKDGSVKVNEKQDQVLVHGEPLRYQAYYYLLMNKAAGRLSATEDSHQPTVIDDLSLKLQNVGLFPVGRLDKDTTGLLLLTNNGNLAHQLLAPNKKVAKRYRALIQGVVSNDDVDAFAKGMDLGDFITQPAQLLILQVNPEKEQSWIEVEIHEGKFHQVKRMFHKVDKEVLSLERIQMGPLVLPTDLPRGHYRPLTPKEEENLVAFGLIK
nr:pseudouridine synthase [Vaginisenegalia massiliensis]